MYETEQSCHIPVECMHCVLHILCSDDMKVDDEACRAKTDSAASDSAASLRKFAIVLGHILRTSRVFHTCFLTKFMFHHLCCVLTKLSGFSY